MEITFSELDNINPYEEKNNYEENNEPYQYWEKTNEQQTKKRVSFNDILSNMSLVVNKNGVLQSIKSSNSINKNNVFEEPYYEKSRKIYQKPIPQMVKNSVIYNKYFKDYVDERTPKVEKNIPKTIEEYNEMVREYNINRFEQRKRRTEIKSTKLFFTNAQQDNHTIRLNIKQKNRNNLKRMGFW